MIFRKQDLKQVGTQRVQSEQQPYKHVPAGAATRRKLKMCINYEDYMKKRNVLHLILLHTITYGLGSARLKNKLLDHARRTTTQAFQKHNLIEHLILAK